MRHYKSGMRWCVWRWSIVDSDYIRRLHLVKTPWGAICLHWLRTPDPEPYLHDHPVSFLSVILWGGYFENRKNARGLFRSHYCDIFNFIRATDRHRITGVMPRTLTLCFMGPKTREWGFYTPDGWIHWKDYYAQQRADKRA